MIAGVDAPELSLIAGEQLPLLRKYCPQLKEACIQTMQAVVEEENLPKNAPDLLLKMSHMPTYISRWKFSAARAAMNCAFALMKVHHPNIDLPVVASGLPKLKEDGTP
jgi:hypothetical protein